MALRQPKYSMEEHARRGIDLYKKQILSKVETGNANKIVAIDIDTGAYEMAEDQLMACQQLLARYPEAQIWCERIGHDAVYHFGLRGPMRRP